MRIYFIKITIFCVGVIDIRLSNLILIGIYKSEIKIFKYIGLKTFWKWEMYSSRVEIHLAPIRQKSCWYVTYFVEEMGEKDISLNKRSLIQYYVCSIWRRRLNKNRSINWHQIAFKENISIENMNNFLPYQRTY